MKKVTILVLVAVMGFVLFYFVTGAFLVYNKPIQSKHLLLEGWLPSNTIESASQYIINNKIDSIWIIGMKPKNENTSNLGFSEKDGFQIKKQNGRMKIAWSGVYNYELSSEKIPASGVFKIGMFGTQIRDIYPYYKIFANKRLLKTGFVTNLDSIYSIPLPILTDTIVNLMICYENDAMIRKSDRNLYITSVFIDSLKVEDIAQKKFFVKKGKKRIPFLGSPMENMKNYLAEFRVDSNKIKIVESKYKALNRTLALANLAGNYLKNTEIEDLNIFTTTYHSRRTYLNFRNCINENIRIGCIASDSENKPRWFKFTRNLDERISLLYSWVYWWFN